ncbi:MAG: DNA topoisomerase I [Candidatus Sungbacteria bacterium GWC2_49_10]|uniref:DNA topoisomerase 1 n=2 Tax=Parcubacteria group TaxID=1794811 RepID=A0A0G1ZIN4_9BACT|nr:MAG: topoisomerase protein [Candidatus Adlerbacteria bacterium GW2011_GWC1_50_9]OGZ94700.1 MAG: DNA topoisomerase I [Candidatus Sungbacteria bacterium GWC2_49_10]
MGKKLIIVESPTKARTISRFLGGDFVVESSYGHVRDLPKSKLGVDVEKNFEPQYVIPRKAAKAVKKLKEEAKKAEKIILATDEDREGEAIAWHLISALGLEDRPGDNIERIVFHEITKRAIEEALANPRDLDMERVNAQQARRILDRLVGYKLSPFLWKKIYRGLSAGRVQSVAVRLIVEREREIEKFKPEEYWTVSGIFSQKNTGNEFEANLSKVDGKALEKFAIPNEAEAKKITGRLTDALWTVSNVEKKATTKNPFPPFTTSTLQQDAFRRLGFSAKRTMVVAQQLYEGVEIGQEGPVGLITYMRTDSLNLSADSVKEAKKFLAGEVGKSYALPSPRIFKTSSKGAQEAHEAIRPTDPARTPESIKQYLDHSQFRLYDLVWRRFIASQMPQALFDTTSVDAENVRNDSNSSNNSNVYTFRATGQVMKFDGFLKIYPTKFTETILPALEQNEELLCKEIKPIQHFTEPPPRFTEASLVKTLEENGIGRPSTYAPIISTIQDRGYVERFERRNLKPKEIGFIVNDMLVEHFPEIVDVQFTARMEGDLDEIAEGTKEWRPVIKEFYDPFAKHLAEKYEQVEKQNMIEETDEVCEKCGKPMVIRHGRFGKFLACSGFPECKNTKTLKNNAEAINMKCPKCTEGNIIIRRTKRGRVFFGCSRYPACDYASWTDPRKPPEEKIKKEE